MLYDFGGILDVPVDAPRGRLRGGDAHGFGFGRGGLCGAHDGASSGQNEGGGSQGKQHDAELSSGVSRGTADLAQVGKAYLAKGAKAFKEGDIRTAYENFDMAVKHNPADAKGHHYLALAAIRIPALARQAVQAIESWVSGSDCPRL